MDATGQALIEAIREESLAQCNAIVAGGDSRAAQILATAEENALSHLVKGKQQADAEAQAIVDKGKIDASMRSSLAMLTARRELVDRVYQRAYERLVLMDYPTYKGWLEAVLGQYAEQGDTVLLDAKSPIPLSDARALSIVKERALSVELGEDIGGGLLISNGMVEKDLSFPSILQSIKEQTEVEVANALFAKKV